MERFKVTKRVAVLGIAANLLLLILKLAAGFFSRSQAMIADGFNSLGDVFASAMTFVGNRIASQPEDKDHPYGHGKAEYIFSMVISFSLLLVAYKIFRSSLDSILYNKAFQFTWWLIGVALFTIFSKIFLFIYARRLAKREENLLISANAEDHRNDVFVTTSTLLGIVFGFFGIYWVDGAVGIGISLWILYTAIRIFKGAYQVLMDTDIDEALKIKVVNIIQAVKGVDHVDDVTAKPVGVGFIVIVKVSIEGRMTVHESHSIAAGIKEKVKDIKNIKDVVVHVNPA
ncbi:MAG: cation diffusion facilitator family transporter [Clostridia bacterium]|nr:cation diffusion facilitator family transporter [Clostridia bacterium]